MTQHISTPLHKFFGQLVICLLILLPLSSNAQGTVCNSNQGITLRSQAEVDNFVATYGDCNNVRTLRIEGNDITNLDGLSNIRFIGNSLFLDNVPNLTNLNGLSNLRSIFGNLLIANNSKITNLDAFSNLGTLSIEVRISNMNNLTSIAGLSNVARISRIRIFNNPKLADCCSIYHLINHPNVPTVIMYGNAGNCTKASILAHPNTSTITVTESDGTNNDGTINRGTTAQLTASGTFDFTWNADASLSATNIANPLATPTKTTTYTVTARGCNNTVDTETFTLTVNNPACNNDSDRDGIPDCNDDCDDRIDSDGDGNPDCTDDCDNRIDTDGDGTPDCRDNCDDRIDSDGDGIPDCIDPCDDRIDSDGDGTNDCNDECPNDPNKIIKDACGCGIPPQIDSDGDGIINCMDPCPYDLNQYVDGIIQCGQTVSSATRLGQSIIDNYGECADDTYAGRELFYRLTLHNASDLLISFKEKNPTGRANFFSKLFVMTDLCTPESCVGTLTSLGETATLLLPKMEAGDYFFAVDGIDALDNVNFELTVNCIGGQESALLACGENNVLFEDFQGYEVADNIVESSTNWDLYGSSSRSANIIEMSGEADNLVLGFKRTQGASDVSLLTGNQHTGVYRVAWDLFVEKGRSAYFNVMGMKGTEDFGAKYLISDEAIDLQNRWVNVEVFVDLDNDRYTIMIDNRTISSSGQFLPNLRQVNFYANSGADFYVDNICLAKVDAIPTNTSRISPIAEKSIQEERSLIQVSKTTPEKMTINNKFTQIRSTFKVFPNPTKGEFRYQGSLSEPTDMTIEIFNQLGQVVRHLSLEKRTIIDINLELNDFPNGLYLLQTYSNKRLDTQRIVLQK